MIRSQLVMDAMKVQQNLMHRTMGILRDTALLTTKMASGKPDISAINEIGELNQASMQRTMDLHANWAQDWSTWFDYSQSISGANTVPKLAERTNNIMLQAQTQAASQMNELSELMENAMVSYSYWIAQKLKDADA